jgi:PadR family transcriptional regulator PadR
VQRNRPPSPQTISVLRALAVAPARWRHGYDLGAETGLKAGSLYPILVRLAERGLLEATWEEGAPPGRPLRHLYRLTDQGRELAAATAAANTAPVARPQRRRSGQPQPGSA